MEKKPWGQSLSIDLSDCDYSLLTNRKKLEKFSVRLCREIKMIPYGKPILKRFAEGELEGYSLMQFIKTSSITAHMDEFGLRAFIDIFSCRKFNTNKAKKFCQLFFKAKKIKARSIYR